MVFYSHNRIEQLMQNAHMVTCLFLCLSRHLIWLEIDFEHLNVFTCSVTQRLI